MALNRRGRPIAALAIGAVLTLGGCASEPLGSADPVGDTASVSVSVSTITPMLPEDATTAAEGTGTPVEDGVFGRITAAGMPVAGAMVQPAPGPGNPAPDREVFAVSAADGSYGIGLAPGVWDITIAADGYQPVVLQVSVPDAGAIEADAVLDPAD